MPNPGDMSVTTRGGERSESTWRKVSRPLRKSKECFFNKLFGNDQDPSLKKIRQSIYRHAWAHEPRDSSKATFVISEFGVDRNVPHFAFSYGLDGQLRKQQYHNSRCNLLFTNKQISADFLEYVYSTSSLDINIDLKARSTDESSTALAKVASSLEKNKHFKRLTRDVRVRIHFPDKYPKLDLPDINMEALETIADHINLFERLNSLSILVVMMNGFSEYEMRLAAFPFYPLKFTRWSIKILNLSTYEFEKIDGRHIHHLNKAWDRYLESGTLTAGLNDGIQTRPAMAGKSEIRTKPTAKPPTVKPATMEAPIRLWHKESRPKTPDLATDLAGPEATKGSSPDTSVHTATNVENKTISGGKAQQLPDPKLTPPGSTPSSSPSSVTISGSPVPHTADTQAIVDVDDKSPTGSPGHEDPFQDGSPNDGLERPADKQDEPAEPAKAGKKKRKKRKKAKKSTLVDENPEDAPPPLVTIEPPSSTSKDTVVTIKRHPEQSLGRSTDQISPLELGSEVTRVMATNAPLLKAEGGKFRFGEPGKEKEVEKKKQQQVPPNEQSKPERRVRHSKHYHNRRRETNVHKPPGKPVGPTSITKGDPFDTMPSFEETIADNPIGPRIEELSDDEPSREVKAEPGFFGPVSEDANNFSNRSSGEHDRTSDRLAIDNERNVGASTAQKTDSPKIYSRRYHYVDDSSDDDLSTTNVGPRTADDVQNVHESRAPRDHHNDSLAEDGLSAGVAGEHPDEAT